MLLMGCFFPSLKHILFFSKCETFPLYFPQVLTPMFFQKYVSSPWQSSLFLKVFLKIHLFTWLHQLLVAACGIFSCNMWDLVLHPGIKPRTSCTGSVESQPLDHQRSSLMVRSLQMQPLFTPWPLVFSQTPLFFLPSFSILSNFHREWSNNPRVLGNGSQCLTIHRNHPGSFTNY